jgi:spermidine synthase
MNTPTDTPGVRAIPTAWFPAAAFLAGAAIMIVEISGNRLIAPVYGNTIYTWTALIGVVLVAMSVGGYFGGRLADRNPRPAMIGVLLGTAGLATTVMPALATAVSGWVEPRRLIAGPLFLSSVMFLIPGILLGAVSPYSVKLLSVLRADHAVGRSAGLVSMMGALGSFVGTFATGFYLLSNFDIRHIIVTTGVALCLLALPFWFSGGSRKAAVSLIVAAIGGGAISLAIPLSSIPGTIFARNTYYHLIRVVERDINGDRHRVLMLDSTDEGAINLEDDSLSLPYQRYWEILTNDPGFQPKRALFIGAGAFGMPRHFAARWETTEVDVAEIDPEVIEVGKKFFRLDSAPRVKPHAADGRGFLIQQPAATYDFIFGDAYNGLSYIPPHLVTEEFFGLVAERLRPGGIYMMNVIGAVRGPAGELTSGVLGGLKTHFPHIAIFTVHRASPEARQNIILMASKEPLDRFLHAQPGGGLGLGRQLAQTRVPEVILSPVLATAKPFTDFRNPIDRIVADALLRDGSGSGSTF